MSKLAAAVTLVVLVGGCATRQTAPAWASAETLGKTNKPVCTTVKNDDPTSNIKTRRICRDAASSNATPR